ncbi:MAG TPA: DNA-directed RNA polymerase subunit omega [Bacteroidales bacterium]|jgi:DNA-directed RNA polymerase subunit K/omega|nr:DNA-directed RNA polymerase subunit omega [Bacteroidales bacterium]
MDSKKTPVPDTTVTRDLSQLSEKTGNIYQTVMIVAQRANQIAAEVKKELNSRLEEFSNFADTLEETFENREQIEISRHYERQPKPTLISIKEFEEGETYYKVVEEPKD